MCFQQNKWTQKDLDKQHNDLVQKVEKVFGEVKKLVEKEKVAEEQDRLRRLQVKNIIECNNGSR
jgi:hypothetical protein